jgi:hypothetical protein
MYMYGMMIVTLVLVGFASGLMGPWMLIGNVIFLMLDELGYL